MKKESAFSGLEAAIVLIAFVVVAAVFSYVMLGAGFFATQKSQEVTYSGIKQSTSNIVLDSQLYGDASPIASLSFSITVPEGGQGQKLSDIEYIFTSTDEISATSLPAYYKDKEGTALDKGTKVMVPTEKIYVSFDLATDGGTLNIGAGEKFTMELKPRIGASTLVSKTLSAGYTKGVII